MYVLVDLDVVALHYRMCEARRKWSDESARTSLKMRRWLATVKSPIRQFDGKILGSGC
jgi:predicted anti-sigma-YlaC factor YlaD